MAKKYETKEDILDMLKQRKAFLRYKIAQTDERNTRLMNEYLNREKEVDTLIDRITGKEVII